MREIGAFEAKNTLGALLDQIESGEEIIITRHGKAVAKLVHIGGGVNREQVRAAAQRIRHRGAALKLGTFDWEALKPDRDGERT